MRFHRDCIILHGITVYLKGLHRIVEHFMVLLRDCMVFQRILKNFMRLHGKLHGIAIDCKGLKKLHGIRIDFKELYRISEHFI